MHETPFQALSTDDKYNLLKTVGDSARCPGRLPGRDIWVVETLRILFEASFGGDLIFKGETAPSNAWRAIRRTGAPPTFSSLVLHAHVGGAPAVPGNESLSIAFRNTSVRTPCSTKWLARPSVKQAANRSTNPTAVSAGQAITHPHPASPRCHRTPPQPQDHTSVGGRPTRCYTPSASGNPSVLEYLAIQ